jgi:hypothetical protein
VCRKSGHAHMLASYACIDCDKIMCHVCAEQCIEADHNVINETSGMIEQPRNEVNRLFNLGVPVKLDLEKVSCPCGARISSKYVMSPISNKVVRFGDGSNPKPPEPPREQKFSLCCVCGTVTCSANCHALYVQDQGKCLYANHFIRYVVIETN